MKNMKKLVAAFAAVAMVMSMGVSAFAEVVTPDVVKDSEGAVTAITFAVGKEGADISINTNEAQITLLAYLIDEKDANGVAYTAETIPAYSNQEIIALDQVGGSAGFGEVPVDTKKLISGKAIAVMLGGSDGTVAKGIIVYNEESGEVTIMYGDVDGNGKVNLKDLSTLKRHLNKWTGYEALVNPDAADVDENDKINLKDLSTLKRHLNKWVGYETLPKK